MIMGNHSKKEWLQWQLTETQQLLEVSKDSLLMKVSLENRIEEIKRQLKELEEHSVEAKISLLFARNAVLGSMGIKSSFASKTMSSIQGMIKTQIVYDAYGEERIGKRGKLGKTKMGEMFLTGLPQGSFGFELSLMNNEDLFAEDYAANSIKEVMDIIQATATDQEQYEKLVSNHPSRMFTYLKDFFKELASENSMLKMESGSHYVELSVDDNMTGYARTTSTHCQENNIKINGVFKGAFVESGKFEFLDEDGNIKHGKISEDIDEDMIVEYIRRYSNENCTMMILERNFTFKDGRKSTSYELIDIQKENRLISDNN